MAIRLHSEDAALLREAIRYTAAETGFSARLIEKDYFCSVALEYLSGECASLTFKGGTCLSKIHGGFFRLSEDLDFSIPTPVESARGERRRSVEPLRQVLARIEERLPGFRVAEPLRGFNNSTPRRLIYPTRGSGNSSGRLGAASSGTARAGVPAIRSGARCRNTTPDQAGGASLER